MSEHILQVTLSADILLNIGAALKIRSADVGAVKDAHQLIGELSAFIGMVLLQKPPTLIVAGTHFLDSWSCGDSGEI